MEQEEGDILIKGIRKRLDGYSERIPEGAWSSLEKELVPVRASSSFSFRKMAVAAAVLIAVITSVSLWVLNMPVDKYIKEVTAVSVPVSTKVKQNEIVHEQKEEVSQPEKAIGKMALAKVEKCEIKSIGQKEPEGESVVDAVISSDDNVVESNSKEQNAEQVYSQKREDKKERKHFYTGNGQSLYDGRVSVNKRDYKKWSVSVSYANTPSIKNSAIPGFSTLDRSYNVFQTTTLQTNDLGTSQNELKKVKPIRKVLLNNVGKDAKTDIEHKMPVTAGVSFRYKLSSNFAVETGLTYTMLSSELRAGSANDFYIEEYKLHYLGIPLKGSWMFLDTKYLTLYLSAGGELEKSLSGKYKKTYVTSDEPEESWNKNVKQVQWSLLGSMGVQFNATENFGIYVEPGVIHYFDDGSEVQTIRKKRPTNFNLQLGLRWTY